MRTTSTPGRLTALAAAATLVIGGAVGGASAAVAAPAGPAAPFAPAGAEGSLTNLAHLDFLLDEVTPAAVEGHTSYRLDTEPTLTLPWTYADARDGGTFERVGGGPLDPETGDYGQGAFNSDDVSRAAVVYLRAWQQGDPAARDKAYEVLRALAYFQTDSGDDAGNVVLWMQPDGELNPSAEPVELPDPSDSAESYWLARTLWAFGEGYAAFRDEDPEFAAFLQERLQLGVSAVDREVLVDYGTTVKADGVDVPAWLIVDGADATAEALLGLSAYVEAAPEDAAVRSSTEKLAEGVAAMARTTTGGAADAAADAAAAPAVEADAGAVDGAEARDGAGGAADRWAAEDRAGSWPYGAALPWAQSRSMWHAWSSQMSGALARASVALDDAALLEPAVVESARFAPTLLTAGGPDNGWYPSPTETVQIAYGADSRVQNLLATADASGSESFDELAALQAAWFFGLNPADEPMYDPATGVTYDGIQPDGSINRNSGAESTIHGLLSMLALDAHPDVAALAQTVTTLDSRHGLTVVQAEDAVTTDGTVVTPESSWTEESSWNGDYLSLTAGQTASFDLDAAAALVSASGSGSGSASASADAARGGLGAVVGAVAGARIVEPVTWHVESGSAETPRTAWTSGRIPLGAVSSEVGEQGITPVPGALLPDRLTVPVPGGRSMVEVRALAGETQLDALLVRPAVSTLAASGADASLQLAQNSLRIPVPVKLGADGAPRTAHVYDSSGELVRSVELRGLRTVVLPPAGFAIVRG
ncbi:hypothetical protein SCB71_18675 [Herbiconiux sp. KACC 21604]|uniref:hypothetical protein n=1 Tax=unclassified Herbiconiux TaxID=2618217 RepID=UPI001C10F763|nr:hypothetical protein [Herbiconiux sp. SALV-R1]WPO86221.1 hypothetical protein SCB71_18675 [Herbiconiux sp. KACC 21604]